MCSMTKLSWRVFMLAILATIATKVQKVHTREELVQDEVPTDYQNYTVLRVRNSDRAIKMLQQFEDHPGVDFWSPLSHAARSIDMMVPPQMRENVVKGLQSEQIPYQITIPDVQSAIAATQGAGTRRGAPAALTERQDASISFDAYQRYSTMIHYMDNVSRKSANQMCSTFTIGHSYHGNTLKGVRCGRGKREIWIDSGIHAREWITPAVVTYIINDLYKNPDSSDDILTKFTIYMLPVANPDGYEYTHTNNRLWRKTRSPNRGAQCVGTDPNRNFDHHWGTGASSNPCSDTYAGSDPFSEPETRAIRDFLLSRSGKMEMFISLHSYSQLILLPYAYSRNARPSDYQELRRVAQIGARALQNAGGPRFRIGQVSTLLYSVGGGSSDWAKDKARIKYSIGFELRDTGRHGFLLPPSLIRQSGRETLAAVKAMIRAIRF